MMIAAGRQPLLKEQLLKESRSPREAPSAAEGERPVGIDPDLVATIAHEMRNILTPLGSAYELLRLAELNDPDAQLATTVIGSQIRQMKRLTDDLLDAQRISNEEICLTPRRTDLREVIASVAKDHFALFAERGITLISKWNFEPVWSDVDVDRLDQVLNNLLSNSLKFTDRGGSVSLILAIDAERRLAIISVRDTGMGMTREVLNNVFQLHTRETSPRNRSGLGLGLPLARRLVELHGGRLEARSGGPGQGSEFSIVLPLSG